VRSRKRTEEIDELKSQYPRIELGMGRRRGEEGNRQDVGAGGQEVGEHILI
jgi:hypothetical protein